MLYDDDEEKKKAYWRINIRTLYEKNKDSKGDCNDLIKMIEDCGKDNSRMAGYCTALIDAVKAQQTGDDSKIEALNKKPHPTYRHNLVDFIAKNSLDISFDVEVPALEEWTHDAGMPDNKGLDKNGLIKADSPLQRLNDYKSKDGYTQASPKLQQAYNDIVEAYKNDEFGKIKQVRESLAPADAAAVCMLFTIRDAICYNQGNSGMNPRGKLPQNVSMAGSAGITPSPQPVHDEVLENLTSDEYMQMLNGASEAVFNQANQITEGITVTSLREVLGTDFEADSFIRMSLDEQDQYLSGNLNPTQLAKFNIAVTDKAEQLGEMMPPHFLTEMAKNIDKSLSAEDLETNLKNTLQARKAVVQEAMKNQVLACYSGDFQIDLDNAAGVHDGTMEMMEYLKQNLPDGLTVQEVDEVISSLELSISEYDEHNGLSQVNEQSAKKIDKAYSRLSENVEKTLAENRFETLLDDDTKDIFHKLEFPATKDVNNQDVSPEENKKTFIELVLYAAAQKTAAAAFGKNKKEQQEAFNAQLQETLIEETIALIQSEEAVKIALDPSLSRELTVEAGDDLNQKKGKLKQYIQNLGTNKCLVSKEGLSGYFAAAVNKHSLFVNRLATKLNNRTLPLLRKMRKPFEKIDRTLINRFGNLYTVPRGIFKQSLTNLPWSMANSVARVAAFSQLGTPWGLACVGGYAAYSLGSTAFRMIRQYRKMKKQNKEMTVGKFFKNNWSGMALSMVGTAVSVIPGMASGVEALRGSLEWMRASGLLSATEISGLSKLGMTNASVLLSATGIVDSAARGTIANRKAGNSFMKSLGLGLTTASLSSVTGMATGMACGQAANHLWQGMDFNLASDVRTPEIKDGRFDPENPDHYSEPVSLGEMMEKMKHVEGFKELMQGLSDRNMSSADAGQKVQELNNLLAEHGMSLVSDKNGDITVTHIDHYESHYNEGVVENAEKIVKQWTRDDPAVYEKNVKTLEPAVEAYNQAHPDDKIDVHRAYLTLLNMGAQAVNAGIDTNINHVDGDADNSQAVPCRGLHTVITEKHIEEHGSEWGITKEGVKSVSMLTDENGLIKPELLGKAGVMETLANAERHISRLNEVGDTVTARDGAHMDGFLHQITIANEQGQHVHSDKGNMYNTYANGENPKHLEPVFAEDKMHTEQWYEKHYMPINPAIDLYHLTVKKIKSLSRIMGNLGKYKENVQGNTRVKPAAATPVKMTGAARI